MDNRYKFNTLAISARYYTTVDGDEFQATDTKELFEENLKKMPEDWKYRDKPVRYYRNSLNYRTKEFDQVDHSNFFIAYGCSFTYGIGLAEDELWTTTVANELSMDHLNYGMGGAGIDFIYLNTLTYLKNTTVRPKFVIVQCPDPARMVMRNLDNFEISGPLFPGTKDAQIMYEQAIKDGSYLHTAYLSLYNILVLWQTAGVPVYLWAMQTEWGELAPNQDWHYYWPTDEEKMAENRARDLMHFPASYQIRTGKSIAEALKNNPKFPVSPVDNPHG